VFNAAQADLAKKAAESLELQVLRIETAEQIELARQLPSGEILAPGRGTVPVVRKELFDKLLALVPSLRDVQLLAGHQSIETTQRYIDGDTPSQRRLVSLL
jgi:hypothetical protein